MTGDAMAALREKRITLIGLGNQGRGQAMNLKAAGLQVDVALRENSSNRASAARIGAPVVPLEAAAQNADLLVFLVPDEVQGALWREVIAPRLKPGAGLIFAHGFSVHFGHVTPPADSDVMLVSPKGAGANMRYREACSWGVHQDASGRATETAQAYARAIVGPDARLIETSFEEEAVSDLFGEQVSLCGGVPAMMRMAFETLVEDGVSPEMAYFDVVQEIKLISDLIAAKGLAGMYEAVSDTAEFGAYRTGPRLANEAMRAEMQAILKDIKSGRFAADWVEEAESGRPAVMERRAANQAHPIEAAGRAARKEEAGET